MYFLVTDVKLVLYYMCTCLGDLSGVGYCTEYTDRSWQCSRCSPGFSLNTRNQCERECHRHYYTDHTVVILPLFSLSIEFVEHLCIYGMYLVTSSSLSSDVLDLW